jgi:hypothetical protein
VDAAAVQMVGSASSRCSAAMAMVDAARVLMARLPRG